MIPIYNVFGQSYFQVKLQICTLYFLQLYLAVLKPVVFRLVQIHLLQTVVNKDLYLFLCKEGLIPCRHLSNSIGFVHRLFSLSDGFGD